MSASGQSWKQEVSVPCVRSPVTALISTSSHSPSSIPARPNAFKCQHLPQAEGKAALVLYTGGSRGHRLPPRSCRRESSALSHSGPVVALTE
jgi:hypothetical protein